LRRILLLLLDGVLSGDVLLDSRHPVNVKCVFALVHLVASRNACPCVLSVCRTVSCMSPVALLLSNFNGGGPCMCPSSSRVCRSGAASTALLNPDLVSLMT